MTIDANPIFRMNFSLWYVNHFKIVASILRLCCRATEKTPGFTGQFFFELILQNYIQILIQKRTQAKMDTLTL